jgi:hypothetical protein
VPGIINFVSVSSRHPELVNRMAATCLGLLCKPSSFARWSSGLLRPGASAFRGGDYSRVVVQNPSPLETKRLIEFRAGYALLPP